MQSCFAKRVFKTALVSLRKLLMELETKNSFISEAELCYMGPITYNLDPRHKRKLRDIHMDFHQPI
jgi:hypothetical protein